MHGGDGGLSCPLEEQELSQRLRRLYPAVNQAETPLPRSWSPKDKYNYIGLSQGNLRVHYKGAGSRAGSPGPGVRPPSGPRGAGTGLVQGSRAAEARGGGLGAACSSLGRGAGGGRVLPAQAVPC